MPKPAENKKNLNKNPPKDPLGNHIQFYTKERGVGLPCVGFKNRSTGQGNEDRSEPSPTFSSNSIHTKSIVDNLQGNGLGKGPDASQVPIRRGNQNPVSQTLLNASKR